MSVPLRASSDLGLSWSQVHNLARFISVAKFRPLIWRNTHPYIIADRLEEATDPELLRQDVRCDRSVILYGYNRGTYMRPGQTIHFAGVGDFTMADITVLDDPCPLPNKSTDKQKRRTLKAAEKTIYAPMCDVSGILFDKDATYIDIPDKHIVFSKPSMLFPGRPPALSLSLFLSLSLSLSSVIMPNRLQAGARLKPTAVCVCVCVCV
jgi:ribosome biogenesis protein BMS1